MNQKSVRLDKKRL